MSKEKVLVLGGAGYIGGLCVNKLLDSNFDVVVYDSLLYEDRYLKDVPFVYGDMRDTEKICSLQRKEKFDSVVILSAIVGDAACQVNPKLTEEVNYKAVAKLCKSLPEDLHLVFSSTCSVYGANTDVVDEKATPNPLSCYAATKLRAEMPVLKRKGTVFRLGTVYGAGDRYSRIRADLVVNTLTIKAFVEKEITVNGGGQYRPIISVRDISGYILEACRRKKDVSGLYNLGYKNVQIGDLAEDIVEEFPDILVNKIDQMYQDNRNYRVNVELSRKRFDYRPQYTVREEIQRLHALLKEGRIKNPYNVNYNNGLFLSQNRI